MRKKLLGNEHPDVAHSLHNLALVLWKQGKLAEAETMFRETLAMYKKLPGDEHADVDSLHLLAELVERRGDLAGAEGLFLELWKIVQSSRPGRPEFQRHFLQHMVTLYEAWSKKDATKSRIATEWKKKLKAFDKAEAGEKSTAAPKGQPK
jgi:tetratricopeptide (TPR) repeat protein